MSEAGEPQSEAQSGSEDVDQIAAYPLTEERLDELEAFPLGLCAVGSHIESPTPVYIAFPAEVARAMVLAVLREEEVEIPTTDGVTLVRREVMPDGWIWIHTGGSWLFRLYVMPELSEEQQENLTMQIVIAQDKFEGAES